MPLSSLLKLIGMVVSAFAFAMMGWLIIRRGMSVDRFLWLLFITGTFLFANSVEAVSIVGLGVQLLAALALWVHRKRGGRPT